MDENRISVKARQHIADSLVISKIWYCGNLNEPEFLSRLYDLSKIASRDHRYRDAYGDIYQHTVNNSDWNDDWVFYDTRFNLMNCRDDEYLTFLINTLHPRVRDNEEQIEKLLQIYNNSLKESGFKIKKTINNFEYPEFIFEDTRIDINRTNNNLGEIRNIFNSDYVSKKIELMQKSLFENPELAIGSAKELLETVCLSVLSTKGINCDPSWNLPRLFNETVSKLKFSHNKFLESDDLEKSLNQMLKGISSIIHSFSEIRNNFGTGHGKPPDFEQIDDHLAKFFIGIVIEIVVLILAVFNSKSEANVEIDVDDVPF